MYDRDLIKEPCYLRAIRNFAFIMADQIIRFMRKLYKIWTWIKSAIVKELSEEEERRMLFSTDKFRIGQAIWKAVTKEDFEQVHREIELFAIVFASMPGCEDIVKQWCINIQNRKLKVHLYKLRKEDID